MLCSVVMATRLLLRGIVVLINFQNQLLPKLILLLSNANLNQNWKQPVFLSVDINALAIFTRELFVCILMNYEGDRLLAWFKTHTIVCKYIHYVYSYTLFKLSTLQAMINNQETPPMLLLVWLFHRLSFVDPIS